MAPAKKLFVILFAFAAIVLKRQQFETRVTRLADSRVPSPGLQSLPEECRSKGRLQSPCHRVLGKVSKLRGH